MPALRVPCNLYEVSVDDVVTPPWEPACGRVQVFQRLVYKELGYYKVMCTTSNDEAIRGPAENDAFSSPPSQYINQNLVQSERLGKRRLWPPEEEVLLGIPKGSTDFMARVPDEDRIKRNARRSSMLAGTTPMYLVAFALQAMLGATIDVRTKVELPFGIEPPHVIHSQEK